MFRGATPSARPAASFSSNYDDRPDRGESVTQRGREDSQISRRTIEMLAARPSQAAYLIHIAHIPFICTQVAHTLSSRVMAQATRLFGDGVQGHIHIPGHMGRITAHVKMCTSL